MELTHEKLMDMDLQQIEMLIRNFDMRITKEDIDLVDAVLTIKRAKAPAPRATGAHRFVDTDLIAKGQMSEREAQAIVDVKTAEAQLAYAGDDEPELDDPAPEVEIDEELVAMTEHKAELIHEPGKKGRPRKLKE